MAQHGKTNQKITQDRPKLLITIVNRSKAEYYADLIQSYESNLQWTALAKGTANKELLNLLGLATADRAVIFSIVREDRIPKLLASLERKFNSIKNGKGIAYTVPLSSIIGVSAFAFLSNNRKLSEDTKHE